MMQLTITTWPSGKLPQKCQNCGTQNTKNCSTSAAQWAAN